MAKSDYVKLLFVRDAFYNGECVYQAGKIYSVKTEAGFADRWIKRGNAVFAKDAEKELELGSADAVVPSVPEVPQAPVEPVQDLEPVVPEEAPEQVLETVQEQTQDIAKDEHKSKKSGKNKNK